MSPELGADGSGLLDFPEVHVILDNINLQAKEGDVCQRFITVSRRAIGSRRWYGVSLRLLKRP
jgi:hypothetical protein